MCGTAIPQGQNVCGNCGGMVSDDDSGADRIIGNPDWGRISIDLGSCRGDVTVLFAKIQECWRELENRSAQGLFSGQLDSRELPISDLELYGPRESYARLVDELATAAAEPSIVNFHSMPFDEIYKLRDMKER